MQQQQLGAEGGGGAASGGIPAQQVGTPCGDAHPDVRLGMIIPWVGPIPLWTSYFVSSARLSSDP